MKPTIQILCLAIILATTNIVSFAQQPQALPCDSVIVTCEAVNATDYVMAIMNVNNIATLATNGANWATPAVNARHQAGTTLFIRKNLGQVFGICYNATGDIFVASTSVYANDFWGIINAVPQPLGTGFENTGSIYKITATGITEFADLPNQGQGLGNICYDRIHNTIYATNFYDGLIYILNATGTIIGTFNPNFDGTVGATLPANFAPLQQRPWGIAVWGTSATNTVLYYSRWSADAANQGTGKHNEIWSVNLNATGIPTGAENLVFSIPFLAVTHPGAGNNYSNPVADIEISSRGIRMLLAERTMSNGYTSAHSSRLIELTRSSISSTLWSNQPYNKFNLGSTSYQINSTGGTDYGEYDLTPTQGVALACDSSVWAMSDYISASAFGLAYGIQVLGSGGGNVASSKIIDLNGVPGTQDKTRLGDVDFRKCLECPPQGTELCNFYKPAPVDSVCCQAGLMATQLTGIPAITSINYTVTGGTIQGFTSSCNIANPNSYSGTVTGTITFVGTCTNLQFVTANLTPTTATGNITVTWTVNFANGTSCTYVSEVKNCPHPVIKCDSLSVKQCICTGSVLSFLDIHVFNQMAPNDAICSVKIQKYDTFGNLQPSPWATGAMVTPLVPFASPWSTIPSSGAMSVNTNSQVNAQVYFSGTFTGYITVTAYHCNGDSCVFSWKPKSINPADLVEVSVSRTRPPFDKYYVAAFKLKANIPNVRLTTVKYFSIDIPSVTGAVQPEIVAITGAQLYQEQTDRKSVSLALAASAHGRENAFFELKNTFTTNDSTQYVHVVFGGALPSQIQTVLYDEDGSVLSQDEIRIDSLTTSTTELTDAKSPELPSIFFVNGMPNPVKDRYNVKLFTDGTNDVNLEVYDITGRLVTQLIEGRLSAGLQERAIDVSQFPNGTYFVKIVNNEKVGAPPLKFVVIH